MFPHRSIHKYTWASPDKKTNNQTDHVLRDKRQHSSVHLTSVQYFRGADCDTDNYLTVANVREELSVSKRAARKFDVERFTLPKFNNVAVRDK